MLADLMHLWLLINLSWRRHVKHREWPGLYPPPGLSTLEINTKMASR
jgi:hypothetical protein